MYDRVKAFPEPCATLRDALAGRCGPELTPREPVKLRGSQSTAIIGNRLASRPHAHLRSAA